MKRLILAAIIAVCLITTAQAFEPVRVRNYHDATGKEIGYLVKDGINPDSYTLYDAEGRPQKYTFQTFANVKALDEWANAEAQKLIQRKEGAARYAAQARERQAAAEAQAVEDAKPINVLFRAYTRYVFVNVCHQNRKGYLMVFVNDVELDRAEKAIYAILAEQKKRDPQIDTDLAYNEALKEISRMPITDSLCHWKYGELMNMSPVAEYVVPKPQ